MRRSAVEGAQEAIERTRQVEDPWLLSYADLVTNLLAFFVLLVSMSSISFDTIDALPAAFDSSRKKAANLKTLSADVQKLVEEEGLRGSVIAEMDEQGLAIQIEDSIVFASGVSELSEDGAELVEKIARPLQKLSGRYRMLVEGHTDDVPISTARFRSNWELSAARALEVRRALAAAGIEQDKLSIMAFAETRPLPAKEGEDLATSRRRNRRVVIRVY